MLTLIAAALAAPAQAAPPVRPAEPQAQHPQHAQPRDKGCACCKDMAERGKMECCDKGGKGSDEHAGHGAHR